MILAKNNKNDTTLEYSELYDVFIHNNTSKEVILYSGLTDSSTDSMTYQFDIDLSVDGEYSYFVIKHPIDALYDIQSIVLDTSIKQGNKCVKLRDLHPDCGLIKNGVIKDSKTYRNNQNKTYIYR